MNDPTGKRLGLQPANVVFSRDQAKALGMTERRIVHRLRTGRWLRVLPNVYAIAGGVPGDLRSHAKAATLWAGDGALAAFGTAAALWRFNGVRTGRTEVWVPPARSRSSVHVVVHRGTRLDRADRDELDGIPITTPTRTLIDVSGRLGDEALLATMEAAFRAGSVESERLLARLGALRTSGRVGAGRLEELLGRRAQDARALESRLETRFWRVIEKSRLPQPVRQHWVIAEGSSLPARLRLADQRVAVECDGAAFHGREHFERDELRRAHLAAANWRIVPVTWRQLTSAPRSVVDRVERARRGSISSLMDQ